MCFFFETKFDKNVKVILIIILIIINKYWWNYKKDIAFLYIYIFKYMYVVFW